jgi:1-aminocyclopropane-1-carboxylate deaminase
VKKTPTSSIFVRAREFFVKRDDLIDPYLAGNKYRKLYTLLQTPPEKYHTLISYGGTQSNAMLAMAALCKKKAWKFFYYTKELSTTQKQKQGGNYTKSLELGMLHKELSNENYRDYIASLRLSFDAKVLVVDQGGASLSAKAGVEILAKEIRESALDVEAIATPSGTGTTALYLAQALPQYTIYTSPSIGDASYLKEQMLALGTVPENLMILENEKKYHFAKPYEEFYAIYQELFEAGIEFDLLYAPGTWKALLEQTSEKILYIHSGGVSGNESMLQRYKQKGFA